jgi:hypothetical protein
MAKKVEVKPFRAIEDGATDWAPIRKNFEDIQEKINEHADELKALAQHATFTISMMFQGRGRHFLLTGGKHLRCRPVNAYAVIHDNIDTEVRVSLAGLAGDIKFSDSEKKGSGKIFDLYPNKILHFIESLEVELSEDRRISVYVTLESVEERE